jgi:hypothetical protein
MYKFNPFSKTKPQSATSSAIMADQQHQDLPYTADQVRQAFIDFFVQDKAHTYHHSSSVVSRDFFRD